MKHTETATSTGTPEPVRDDPGGRTFADDQVVADRYRIVRFIAAGGMGEVYEAEDRVLGKRVALKTMRPGHATSERGIERFRREIQLAHRVTHPSVCRTF